MSISQTLLPAFRLRTLPLAASSIIVGTALAIAENGGNWQSLTFVLSLFTAFSLQILSNIANDYGDGVKGTDARQLAAQPDGLTQRVTGAKMASPVFMRSLLLIWAMVTLLLGVILIINATQSITDFWGFMGLGVLSIVAALTYTIGKRAYGYYGLGDLAVFIFFGLVGVLGSVYLQVHRLFPEAILAAIAVGCLCVAVLNINNLRDRETDRQSGKLTLALALGEKHAKRYHTALIIIAFFSLSASMVKTHSLAWLYLLSLPGFIWHCQRLLAAKNSTQLGKELPVCVGLTLLCCLLFAAGQLL